MKVIEYKRLQYCFNKNVPGEKKMAEVMADVAVNHFASEGYNTTREHHTESEIAEGRRMCIIKEREEG